MKDRIGNSAEVLYAQGYIPEVYSFGGRFSRNTPEQLAREAREKEEQLNKLHTEALELAARADIILFVGGNNRAVETEGSDRSKIMLPSGQDDLIKKIAEVNSNIVTILVSGGPNDLNTVKPLSKALLISWFNGTEGGNALADVLLGNISPSGRLPFTLPVKLEDSPAYALGNYPQGRTQSDIFANLVAETNSINNTNQNDSIAKPANDPNTALYSEGSLVGYRWFDTRNVELCIFWLRTYIYNF